MALVLLVLWQLLTPTRVACMHGWVVSDEPVDPLETLTVRFALRAANPNALDEAFAAVSDPKSPKFRKYLNRSQISELVAPTRTSVESVAAWARHEFGVEVTHGQYGEHLFITAPIGALSRSLAGVAESFAVYRHSDSAHRTVRMALRDPSVTPTSLVPAALRAHVWAVLDVIELLPVPPRRQTPSLRRSPGDKVDPDVIHAQYKLTDSESIGGRTTTSQGVAAFEQAEFLPQDVAAFEEHYHLPKIEFHVDGPNDGGYYGEAGLDTQYIVTSGRGVASWFISQDAFDMLAWCEKVLNMAEPPSVLSISWGSGESGYRAEHMTAASACFQKMGLRGISVFVASGDEGTGKQGLFRCNKFDPVWPASCPYVTAVGGTYLQSGVEHGWSGSGGGFSAVFARPSFQDAAVSAYKSSASLPPSSLFVEGGRAVPDVAALATNYQVFSGGVPMGTLTGTSAATPTFAGMVSVVNDLLVAEGKPTVGFASPALYAAAAGGDSDFLGFDVTAGNNKASGCEAGFSASPGWDPVTGLGTPQWVKLKAALGLHTEQSLLV